MVGRISVSLLLGLVVLNGGIIPFYIVVRQLGLVDTYGALVVPYLWNHLALLYCIEELRRIPAPLLEGAALEGSGPLGTLWRVVLPVRIRLFAAVGVVQFVQHWNNWFAGVLFIHTNRRQPVQVFLRRMLFADTDFRSLGVSREALSQPEKMSYVIGSLIPIAVLLVVLGLLERRWKRQGR